MRHVVSGKSIALAGSLFILLIAFVAYRARTFNYCAGYEIRAPRFSIVSGDQACGAGEESAALQNLWRRAGTFGKARIMGQMVVHSFLPGRFGEWPSICTRARVDRIPIPERDVVPLERIPADLTGPRTLLVNPFAISDPGEKSILVAISRLLASGPRLAMAIARSNQFV